MSTSTVPVGGSLASTLGRYRWLICGLLFLATTVNYIDRQVLALIKGTLDNELRWTNAAVRRGELLRSSSPTPSACSSSAGSSIASA